MESVSTISVKQKRHPQLKGEDHRETGKWERELKEGREPREGGRRANQENWKLREGGESRESRAKGERERGEVRELRTEGERERGGVRELRAEGWKVKGELRELRAKGERERWIENQDSAAPYQCLHSCWPGWENIGAIFLNCKAGRSRRGSKSYQKISATGCMSTHPRIQRNTNIRCHLYSVSMGKEGDRCGRGRDSKLMDARPQWANILEELSGNGVREDLLTRIQEGSLSKVVDSVGPNTIEGCKNENKKNEPLSNQPQYSPQVCERFQQE